MNISANATAPLTAQWQKDGTNISGSFIDIGRIGYPIVGWQPADAGVYRVTLTNALGSVTSRPARFWVNEEAGWTYHNPLPTDNGLGELAVINGKFVATGARGGRYSSADGAAWTQLASLSQDRVLGCAFGNGRHVFLSTIGFTAVSTDGENWRTGNMGVYEPANSIAFGQGLFAVTTGSTFDSVSGRSKIFTSPDGVVWTERYNTMGGQILGARFGNGIFAAFFDDGGNFGRILRSSDGIDWSLQSALPVKSVSMLEFANGTWLIISDNTALPVVLTSPDGATWTNRTTRIGGATGFSSLASDGTSLVAVGTNGVIARTTNGTAWTPATGTTTSTLNDVTYAGGRYLAVGATGALRTSTDGAAWAGTTIASTNNLRFIGVLNGIYLTTADGGNIRRSTDGTTWTAVTSGTPHVLFGAAYGAGTYVAVGGFGTVLTSSDGIAWTPRGFNVTDVHQHVHFNGTYFTVSGATNAIYLSPDGIAWDGRHLGGAPGLNETLAYNGRLYGVSSTRAAIVSAGFAPAIAQQPVNQTFATGTALRLNVLAAGTPLPTAYQWLKNGVNLAGATSAAFSQTNAAPADGGVYLVVVTDSAGSVTSNGATVTVIGAGISAAHAVVGGGTVTITSTINHTGTASALGWQVLLPTGWSFASDAGSAGDIKPLAGQTALLEWGWTSIPASPVAFTYTLNVPAGTTGDHGLVALMILRQGGSPLQILARPDPLVVGQMTTHDADTDRNFRFSLLGLTRVIELYNTRNGTTRTGAYRVEPGSEDGFNPDPARAVSAVVALTRYHSADPDRNGRLSLFELTRMIELYNFRSGTTRTGDYHVHTGTEDGFNPGPLAVHPDL